MSSKKLAIGIDLGTSNSVVAVRASKEEETRVIGITQIVGAGQVGEQPLLPSSLYLPNPNEIEKEKLELPWQKKAKADSVVGSFARDRGALSPERAVSSAKSWLCNSQVDRKAAILPWKSEIAEEKVSPFDASKRYLSHMRSALELDLARQDKPFSLDEAEVVLTVPASFDEVARALTHEAAEEAGWGNVTLLEEPQAAFYAWIAGSGKSWRDQVKPGDLVLVCDVGGGTADFSLIMISQSKGNLELDRISVGEHILLGGDNMDLALAHAIKGQLEGDGVNLDNWQFLSLVHASRAAKEVLLGQSPPDEVPISIPSRGSSLFAKTISTRLTRKLAEKVILDGFLPLTKISEEPRMQKALGLQEYGLAYAADPALSKQLSRFLARSMTNVRSDQRLSKLVEAHLDTKDGEHLLPTAVLFNGGVFKSEAIRKRSMELLASWCGKRNIRTLEGADLDLAVARGAAQYAFHSIKGEGLRIRAGAARSYYLGLESSMPAVPGYAPPVKGLCIVPQGMEEGSELSLKENEFGLVIGEAADFRLFSSSVRAGDKIGSIVENAAGELEETSSVSVTLPAKKEQSGEVVPVYLNSVMTEVGTLELWMHHSRSEQRWKLEFNVRTQ